MRRLANKRERDLLLSLYDYRCAVCEEELEDGKFQIDHQQPVADRGVTKWWNMQPLCLKCHFQKSREAASGASSKNQNID
jgi:5-methylcytosine-specific restriction endonuclease McrA